MNTGSNESSASQTDPVSFFRIHVIVKGTFPKKGSALMSTSLMTCDIIFQSALINSPQADYKSSSAQQGV